MVSDQRDGDQAHQARVEVKNLHAVDHLVMLAPRMVSHCRHPESCSAIVYWNCIVPVRAWSRGPHGVAFLLLRCPYLQRLRFSWRELSFQRRRCPRNRAHRTGGRDSLCGSQHVDALWAALLGRSSYFLRTSFMPQHMSFAGAPPSQATPAISKWSASTRVSVAACMCLSFFGSKLAPPANSKRI